MKLVLDTSVLIAAYVESSRDHLMFLERFLLLNQQSSQTLALCVSNVLLEDYQHHLGKDFSAQEHYHKWLRQVGDLDSILLKSVLLGPTQEGILTSYSCIDPVEHEIIALAFKAERKIVAALESELAKQKRYLTHEQVLGYLADWGISVDDVASFEFHLSSEDDPVVYRRQLRRLMKESFQPSDLRELCFDLGAEDYVDLHRSKRDMVIDIVEHFRSHGRMGDLLEYIDRKRPHQRWPEVAMLS